MRGFEGCVCVCGCGWVRVCWDSVWCVCELGASVCVVCVSVLKVSGWVGVMCVSDTSTHPHTHPHTHTPKMSGHPPTHTHTQIAFHARRHTHTSHGVCVCVCGMRCVCVWMRCVCAWKFRFGRILGSKFCTQSRFYIFQQAAYYLWVDDVKKIDVKAIFTVAETLSNLTLFHETVKIGAASIFFHIYTNRQDCKLILTIKVSRLRNTGA